MTIKTPRGLAKAKALLDGMAKPIPPQVVASITDSITRAEQKLDELRKTRSRYIIETIKANPGLNFARIGDYFDTTSVTVTTAWERHQQTQRKS